MKTITNYHKRQFRSFFELSPNEQKKVMADFDYLDSVEEEDFILYKDRIYHLSEFMFLRDPFWTGYAADSYFSGILIKLAEYDDDYDFIIGWYLS